MAATKPKGEERREGARGGGGGGRMRKDMPARPDDQEYKDKIEIEQKAIDELQSEMRKVQGLISERSAGKEDFQRKREEMRSRLDDLQAHIDKLEQERKSTLDQISQKQEDSKKMRSQVQDMKRKVGYKNEEEIDNRIAEIEYQMHTSTMSLKEEKKFMEEIKKLKKDKPQLAKYNRMESTFDSSDDQAPLRDRLFKISTDLNAAREARRGQNEHFKKLINDRRDQVANLKEFFDKRTELNNKIQEHIANVPQSDI
mmetsp:Transcript_9421/g.27150  ORF Transcript_9421/g.27150 Transcript_9421/m.27150 type:complete len:256 (+) Transcript_9421:251-1018(+)